MLVDIVRGISTLGSLSMKNLPASSTAILASPAPLNMVARVDSGTAFFNVANEVVKRVPPTLRLITLWLSVDLSVVLGYISAIHEYLKVGPFRAEKEVQRQLQAVAVTNSGGLGVCTALVCLVQF